MRSFVLVAVLAGGASAAPMTITGEVVDARSHWTADGTRIVTDATVHTDTGDVVVRQQGGTVDGIGQRTFPGPAPLVQGMRATVVVNEAYDLSQHRHLVVEGVKVLAAPPGYVRTGPTKAGNYLYWESGCVFITVDADGTKEIPGDREFEIVDQTIQAWNSAISSCSYMQIINAGRKKMEVGRDHVNLIKFRDVAWCPPALADDASPCHPGDAAGITTATFVDDPSSSRDGAIVDADIELNGENFALADDGETLGTESCLSELRNTLTHELGHLLGLEHTCRTPTDPPRVDGDGNSVPSCSNATTEQQNATMYNFQECGETKKETLEPDDIAGACAIYPLAEDPGTCEPVGDGGGCCSSGNGPAGPLALVGLVLLTSVWRRRR